MGSSRVVLRVFLVCCPWVSCIATLFILLFDGVRHLFGSRANNRCTFHHHALRDSPLALACPVLCRKSSRWARSPPDYHLAVGGHSRHPHGHAGVPARSATPVRGCLAKPVAAAPLRACRACQVRAAVGWWAHSSAASRARLCARVGDVVVGHTPMPALAAGSR